MRDLRLNCGFSEGEVRRELALALFVRDRLTVAQAAQLANLSQTDFQSFVASRVSALLSEAALAADWNRPEEDEAWSHLRQAS